VHAAMACAARYQCARYSAFRFPSPDDHAWQEKHSHNGILNLMEEIMQRHRLSFPKMAAPAKGNRAELRLHVLRTHGTCHVTQHLHTAAAAAAAATAAAAAAAAIASYISISLNLSEHTSSRLCTRRALLQRHLAGSVAPYPAAHWEHAAIHICCARRRPLSKTPNMDSHAATCCQ
jgi:hypothetical protein